MLSKYNVVTCGSVRFACCVACILATPADQKSLRRLVNMKMNSFLGFTAVFSHQ